MKSKTKYDITTSKGSKDVRNQFNRLSKESVCRLSELRAAITRVNAQIKAAQKRSEDASIAFNTCLARLKITKEQWSKRYGTDNSEPCVKEFFADIAADDSARNATQMKPWAEHNSWLQSMQSIGRLAKVYPDSVQAKHLTYYLDWADAAKSCISQKRWCYNG
jgi:hypothetical protein